MLNHSSSCLQGPITRARDWWSFGDGQPPRPANASETPPMMDTSEQPPIRAELVERIRREIAAGVYETPEKLEIALARLVDAVRGNSAGRGQ